MTEKIRIEIYSQQPPLNAPLAFLKKMGAKLGLEEPQDLRSQPKLLSLAGLTLLAELDSETPFHKFLEAQPCRINIDKIERKKYLLSGTIKAFREVYLEHKEQKVSKALLIFLIQHFPEFFDDLWPKHGLLPPAGINFRLISAQEIEKLELALRLRHLYLLSSFTLPLAQLVKFFELELKPVIWELVEDYAEGFFFEPLIQYMALVTRFLTEEPPLKEIARKLLLDLKERHPEPFGLIPET